MPVSYIYKKMIREEIKKLKKPVLLKLFTSSDNLQESVYMTEILNIYQQSSNGMLIIEEHRFDTSSTLFKQYDINTAPVFLLVNEHGKELIRYLAVPMGSEIQPFIQTLLIFTGAPNYYETVIKENLNKIKPSTLQVMITEFCAYCPTILSICGQLALASEGKIRTIIIDIMTHSEIGEKYGISTVPYVVVNDNKPLVGNVKAEEIIKELLDENI